AIAAGTTLRRLLGCLPFRPGRRNEIPGFPSLPIPRGEKVASELARCSGGCLLVKVFGVSAALVACLLAKNFGVVADCGAFPPHRSVLISGNPACFNCFFKSG